MNEETFDLDAYLEEIAADLAEEEDRQKRWRETRSRALLLSVERLGRKPFEMACHHSDSVLIFDLETYDTDILNVSDLPHHFNMARRGQGLVDDALFCESDFEQLRDLKQFTHGKSTLIRGHNAIPVFIAPQRLHTDQNSAWVCVCVWDRHMGNPWTNLPLINP